MRARGAGQTQGIKNRKGVSRNHPNSQRVSRVPGRGRAIATGVRLNFKARALLSSELCARCSMAGSSPRWFMGRHGTDRRRLRRSHPRARGACRTAAVEGTQHPASASSGASCVEEILVHQGRQLSMGVQADAEPRRDGVTAAFRSKTRRLLPLPRPCRPRAPHSWARRPSWSLILHGEWTSHKGARRLRSAPAF